MSHGIEPRLDNWGRWSRNSGRKLSSSPLYRLMKENDPAYSPSEPTIRADEADAVLVDRVIMLACSSLEKEILKERYIRQMPNELICRRNRLRFENFPSMMQKTLSKLELALKSLTITGENKMRKPVAELPCGAVLRTKKI